MTYEIRGIADINGEPLREKLYVNSLERSFENESVFEMINEDVFEDSEFNHQINGEEKMIPLDKYFEKRNYFIK